MKIANILLFIILQSFSLIAQNSGCPAAFQQYKNGHFNAAVQSYTICLASFPEDYFSLFNRGICLEKLGRIEEAEKDYWKAFSIEYSFIEPIQHMAELQLENKNTAAAIAILNKAIGISNAKEARVFNYRGWLYFRQEKFRLAFEDFSRAIQLDSLFASAYNNRASSRYLLQNVEAASRKDIELAAQDYSIALSLDSNQSGIWRNLAYVNILLENYEKALQFLDNAAAENTADPILFMYRAQAEYALGNLQEALAAYDKALLLNPNLYGSRLERAEIYLAEKQWASLEKDLDYLSHSPDKYKAKAAYVKAKMLLLREEDKQAFSALKLAKKLGLFEDRKKVLELKNEVLFEDLKKDKPYRKWLERL